MLKNRPLRSDTVIDESRSYFGKRVNFESALHDGNGLCSTDQSLEDRLCYYQ